MMLIFKKKNTGKPIRDYFTAEFDGNATWKAILKVWVFLSVAGIVAKYVGEYFGF